MAICEKIGKETEEKERKTSVHRCAVILAWHVCSLVTHSAAAINVIRRSSSRRRRQRTLLGACTGRNIFLFIFVFLVSIELIYISFVRSRSAFVQSIRADHDRIRKISEILIESLHGRRMFELNIKQRFDSLRARGQSCVELTPAHNSHTMPIPPNSRSFPFARDMKWASSEKSSSDSIVAAHKQ